MRPLPTMGPGHALTFCIWIGAGLHPLSALHGWVGTGPHSPRGARPCHLSLWGQAAPHPTPYGQMDAICACLRCQIGATNEIWPVEGWGNCLSGVWGEEVEHCYSRGFFSLGGGVGCVSCRMKTIVMQLMVNKLCLLSAKTNGQKTLKSTHCMLFTFLKLNNYGLWLTLHKDMISLK